MSDTNYTELKIDKRITSRAAWFVFSFCTIIMRAMTHYSNWEHWVFAMLLVHEGILTVMTFHPRVSVQAKSTLLKKYEKIIHISITSKVSFSYQNAQKARENMTNEKDRIFVLDSKHLSTGMAHIIMRAVDFIVKPFVPEVMLSRVSRALELEDLRRELSDKLEQKTKEVTDIKAKSCQDALTGLWNRSHTEEVVNELLSSGESGALMMIDMDNFKAINDTYGHIAGDQVLKMFAETLREFSDEGDVLCRIGGDEFVVFLKGETSKKEIDARRRNGFYNSLQCGG